MLCHAVTPANRARYADQMDEMFRQRHRFFVETMGWSELERPDGRDIDDHDSDESTYLMVLGDQGDVFSSVRLNPTWARHQLEENSDLRARYVSLPVPKGPTVWECSRLLGGEADVHGKWHAAISFGLLLSGLSEFCQRRRIIDILSILEMTVVSRFQTFGYRCTPLGLPVRYETRNGPADSMATTFRAGGPGPADLRRRLNLVGPAVFEAAPVVDGQAIIPIDFPLLASVADIETDEGRSEALKAIRSIRELELENTPRERKPRSNRRPNPSSHPNDNVQTKH